MSKKIWFYTECDFIKKQDALEDLNTVGSNIKLQAFMRLNGTNIAGKNFNITNFFKLENSHRPTMNQKLLL